MSCRGGMGGRGLDKIMWMRMWMVAADGHDTAAATPSLYCSRLGLFS